MANPNNVMKYAAKRPFDVVVGYDRRDEAAARERVADLTAAGWEAKVTCVRHRNGCEWNVWKRERAK